METKEQLFTDLIRENKNAVYTVCYMFSKDENEINDLFQDIMVNLWKGFERYRGDCSPSTWIWKVSLNTCISSKRKSSGGEHIPLTSVNLFTDTDEDTRQIQQLRHRISRLAIMDRAIILLWLEDMSYDDIAAIVGITPKNVSVRLVRIKEKLMNMKEE